MKSKWDRLSQLSFGTKVELGFATALSVYSGVQLGKHGPQLFSSKSAGNKPLETSPDSRFDNSSI